MPTNNYLPPAYHVRPLPSESSSPWETVPPVALLTDPHGEEIPDRPVSLRLAWDEDALSLRAESPDQPATRRPDLAPDSDEFWMQDHVEFRFLPDPDHPHNQTQFILATDGRWWDNRGLWQQDSGIQVEEVPSDAGWCIEARMPWQCLELPAPHHGDVIRGIIAHTRWENNHAVIAGISATELAFNQHQRFAELIIDPPACTSLTELWAASPDQPTTVNSQPSATASGVADGLEHAATDSQPRTARTLQPGPNPFTVTLTNHAENPLRGRLHIWREHGPDTSGESRTIDCTLQPGRNEIPVALELERPPFRRLRFAFESDGRVRELAAVSLRAGVPDLRIEDLSLQHPYLVWTPQALELTEQKAKNPAFARFAAALQQKAEDLPLPPDCEQFPKLDRPGQLKYLTRAVGTSLEAWILGRDPACHRCATEYVRTAREIRLPDAVDLREGMAIGKLAIAYDAFAAELTEEDRRAWVELLSRFLDLYLRTARRRHWNSTTIANANSVCNGGGGLLALALLGENEDAPEALYLVRKLIRQYIDYCYGHDGGCTEGAQYWQYGMSNYLRFVTAMERVLGTDDGLLRHPAIEHNINMIRLALSNDGKLHGVNDTIPLPVGSNVAMFLAGRFDDDFALWYADLAEEIYARLREEGRDVPYQSPAAWAMRFRPDKPRQTDRPPLPRAILLESIQYATLRSDTRYDCSLVAGLKGSRPPYTHHNQPDSGSFYVHVRGERLLIDPGYYKDEPTHHSLPIIDGVAPEEPQEFVAEIKRCESHPGLRLAVCDATRAYRGAAKSVRRTLAMVGEEGLILLDDIVPHGHSVDVTTHYQAGGPTARQEDSSVMITGEETRLHLRILGRPDAVFQLHEECPLDDIHWGYKFAECRWFPLSLAYTATARQPLITVILDATDGDPGRPGLDHTPHTTTVTMPSGRKIRFAQLEGAFHIDANFSSLKT